MGRSAPQGEQRFYEEKAKQLFRAGRLRAGCGRQRRGRRQPVAVPLPGREGRRRPVPAHLPGAGGDHRLHPAHLGHCHRPQNQKERHRRLHRAGPQVEIFGHSHLFCACAHHDLLCGHRRVDHQIRRGVPHRPGQRRRAGRLLHRLHHLAGVAGGVRPAVHGGHGLHRVQRRGGRH